MLSDVEMWREFRKGGIVIYPLMPNNTNELKVNNNEYFRSNIDGASIYVTASDVGWCFAESGTENACNRLQITPDNKLIIPANEWVILCSQETIYLSDFICGTCINKLSLALQGLEHISAPLKPGCHTRLLMVFHNHTAVPIKIKIGSQIAVVTFDRLNTKPSINGNSHTDRNVLMKTLGYDIEVLNRNFAEGNTFLCPHTKEEAKVLMDKDIEEHKKQIKANKNGYGYKFTGGRIIFTKSLVARVIALVVSVGLIGLSFIPSLERVAEPMKYIGGVLTASLILAFAGNSLAFLKNER